MEFLVALESQSKLLSGRLSQLGCKNSGNAIYRASSDQYLPIIMNKHLLCPNDKPENIPFSSNVNTLFIFY